MILLLAAICVDVKVRMAERSIALHSVSGSNPTSDRNKEQPSSTAVQLLSGIPGALLATTPVSV